HCALCSSIPRPPPSPLFPYTTLFRSGLALSPDGRFLYAAARSADAIARFERDAASGDLSFQGFVQDGQAGIQALGGVSRLLFSRSEEHTSELQSRFDLVCRLLLEKKN